MLKGMVDYMSGLKSFTCTARSGYEVVQTSGQKIEFGETRHLTLARPDKLRVEEVSNDDNHDLALFDGKQITIYDADAGAYAQAPQPGTGNDALVYFIRDLHMRMPLALMLSSNFKSELPAIVKTVDYVETEEINGKTVHHIAGRTACVDFQFWIADGPKPLPQRVIITYKKSAGQPQYWADMSEWNTNPMLASSVFNLALPKDARKIAFAVQLTRPGSTQTSDVANGVVKP
ncbi:MAG: DUF2092 domain-containing protein [Pseudomonadota bacterium]